MAELDFDGFFEVIRAQKPKIVKCTNRLCRGVGVKFCRRCGKNLQLTVEGIPREINGDVVEANRIYAILTSKEDNATKVSKVYKILSDLQKKSNVQRVKEESFTESKLTESKPQLAQNSIDAYKIGISLLIVVGTIAFITYVFTTGNILGIGLFIGGSLICIVSLLLGVEPE